MRELPAGIRVPLFGLLSLLAYATIWGVGFLSDDHNLLEDPSIWGFGAKGFSRPLAAALISVELHLLGPSSGAFHAVSLALHALNATLLSLVLRDLELPQRWQLAGAGLFAVAPLHSEAVYWMSCQSYLLECSCLLAGWLAVHRAVRSDAPAGWLLALGFAAGALLSRESGIVVPIALAGIALHEGWRRGRARSPWLLAFPALAALQLLAHLLRSGSSPGSYALSLGVNVPRNLLHFLASCLFLTPFDDGPLVALAMRAAPGLAEGAVARPPGGLLRAAVIAIAALAMAWGMALRGRDATRLGLALMLLATLPYLPMRSPLGIHPHRFYYLPALGAAVALAATFDLATREREGASSAHGRGASRRLRRAVARAPLLAAVAGLLLAAQTALRGLDYRRATVATELVLAALGKLPLEEGIVHVVHGAPDAVDDAYVFRNGLGAAMRRWTRRPELTIDTDRVDPGPLPNRRDLELVPGHDGFTTRWITSPD